MKILVLTLATAAFLTSCNTMIGLGRDTRLLGENVEKSAEKAAPSDAYDTDSSGAPIY